MPKFNVLLPFVGYVSLEVVADDEESAIENAFAQVDMSVSPGPGVEVIEWDFVEYVSRGNVCSAPLFEAEASEIEGDD